MYEQVKKMNIEQIDTKTVLKCCVPYRCEMHVSFVGSAMIVFYKHLFYFDVASKQMDDQSEEVSNVALAILRFHFNNNPH